MKRCENIAEALEENFLFEVSFLVPYVPIMELLESDVIVNKTQIPDETHNIVVKARFSEADVDRRVKETIEIFQKENLPFSWWVGPFDTPKNLRKVLQNHGLQFSQNDYGMFFDLKPLPQGQTQKLVCKHVKNLEDMKIFDSVHVKSGGNPDFFDCLYRHMPSEAFAEKTPYQFYTGYVEGKPVTTGALVFHGGVAGIYYIMTVPAERRKGYATEMMFFLLREAKKRNFTYSTLLASETGKKVYEKIGFQECCLFQEFSLPRKAL